MATRSTTSRDLARKIAELHPNTPVKLSIVRYGEKREVDMNSALPQQQEASSIEEDKPDRQASG